MLVLVFASSAGAQQSERLMFSATDANIANPERGFFRFRDLTNLTNLTGLRAQGQTLVYGRVLAEQFRDRPLDAAFLAKIQAGFDEARKHGVKVKFRLAYNDSFGEDAPKSVILNHIQQLQPVWEKNQDVMFHMDAGFIGAWGEWHSSTNGLDNHDDRRDILFAILDALPQDRTVGIRTPHYKREIFSGSATSDESRITAENAFDGSRLTRVGHLNDCFLSSATDFGTYAYTAHNWPLERELDYIGQESLYVPFGGETCSLHVRNQSAQAIAEMEQLHIDYLNLDYHPQVIQRWKEDGSFDEIQRRLGYRFELETASLPATARPGSVIPFDFQVNNVGFGELFNPRQVEVVLRHTQKQLMVTAPLRVDPRRWAGGTENEVTTWLMLPRDLPTGDYSVGLWLPDIEPTLRADSRYAIRFANENLWDEDRGVNWLTSEFHVSTTAKGAIYDAATEFREVEGPMSLSLTGDFNRDFVLDARDMDLLTLAVESGDQGFDLSGDHMIDEQDRSFWIEVLAQSRAGDADLDGDVDFADFLSLASNFGEPGGWAAGNFDGEQEVSFADFLILSTNYQIRSSIGLWLDGNAWSPPPNSATGRFVPEPDLSRFGPFMLASMMLIMRASRR